MSGVTVATMTRSTSEPASPASSSASCAAGSARSESASSGAAIRRSRIPVRSTIHSSEVSISVESSSFVITRSGTCAPRPVIEIATPFEEPITMSSRSSFHRERERAAGRQLAVHLRRRFSFPDRAADGFEPALELELVARLDDPLEAHVVDPREEREPAAILLLGKHSHCACLGHRLDDQDPWHHGPSREVARQVPLVRPHRLPRDHALARLELDDLVDQEKRLAVREDRLDLRTAE